MGAVSPFFPSVVCNNRRSATAALLQPYIGHSQRSGCFHRCRCAVGTFSNISAKAKKQVKSRCAMILVFFTCMTTRGQDIVRHMPQKVFVMTLGNELNVFGYLFSALSFVTDVLFSFLFNYCTIQVKKSYTNISPHHDDVPLIPPSPQLAETSIF